MNKYTPYTSDEIHILLHRTGDISSNPYKLFSAFALSCLYDTVVPDPEDDDNPKIEDMFTCRADKHTVDRMLREVIEEFNAAAENYSVINVWNKTYSIRKSNAYDKERLKDIFNFRVENDEYIISKDGIMDLEGDTSDYAKSKMKTNRLYLRQIIKLAENDNIDGWELLTEMEVAMYCWAKYYNERQSNNHMEFLLLYSDYFDINDAELKACWTDKAIEIDKPCGMYTFDADKVLKWNNAHKQPSEAIHISQQEADDYWYDVTLKTLSKQ